MIRDPSDGSVKAEKVELITPTGTTQSVKNVRFSSEENWGLKSLDRKPKESTFKPMNAEELAEHYARHDLGRKLKEQK